ncbi:hypothetical protein GMW39_15450 [Pectobacterium parmentieri]|uniref:hypothetical protein n=1 Tax=Pectobacterium TaxID=122277 RepID=UPI0013743DD5|nr:MULTISPECIES: hypothetical protein [Pectobacterium]MBQ4761534.1 hypothetical protein [Pectobacterium versatile]MCA6926729.1 hypothetical protein [Pectobacterium versatile]MCH5083476.1 hypothetical protein [Pectobacterium versatile]QHQ17106.1 hypothetical protein GMW39_15450 [Pectobacterium parmentieri]
MELKHNPEIWLQAADDAANSFLSQPESLRFSCEAGAYTRLNVLTSLDTLADAVYYLNYPLYQFIKCHMKEWYHSDCAFPPEFLRAWRDINSESTRMKINI